MSDVEVTSRGLTVADVSAIAEGRENLTITEDLGEFLAKMAGLAAQTSATRAVYGRSTGVGANRSVPVHDPDGQLDRLLRSHATSAGLPRDPVRVRAAVAVRIAQLARGGSGLSRIAFQGLLQGVNDDTLPQVLEFGSIGTGDLSVFARIGVWLLDAPGGPRILPSDALPLMSSNAASLGDAALATYQLREIADAALAVASLTLRAVSGNVEAFGSAVELATPFCGAREVCVTMRDLLDRDGYVEPPARIQDPFGLRAMPQGHGVLMDALSQATSVIEAMANAPSENPVFDELGGVTHHGAFHAAFLTHAMDGLLGALAQAAQLGIGRTVILASPDLTGGRPFLADETPGASGTMGVEFVAASALARLRSLATPAAVQTVVLSRGLEDDASFASVSARNALAAVAAYRVVVACELLTAARALLLFHPERLPTWDALGPLLIGLCEDADRDLTADLQVAELAIPALAALTRI
ncbi:MAG: aromatic amino acid lyase [Terracoccus sp.]